MLGLAVPTPAFVVNTAIQVHPNFTAGLSGCNLGAVCLALSRPARLRSRTSGGSTCGSGIRTRRWRCTGCALGRLGAGLGSRSLAPGLLAGSLRISCRSVLLLRARGSFAVLLLTIILTGGSDRGVGGFRSRGRFLVAFLRFLAGM